MTDISDELLKVLISVISRQSIGIERINTIVQGKKKKGNPKDFVRVYNSLDGTKTISELARMVGITKQGMASVLKTWEEEGIVFHIGKAGKYFGLLTIPNRMIRRKKK